MKADEEELEAVKITETSEDVSAKLPISIKEEVSKGVIDEERTKAPAIAQPVETENMVTIGLTPIKRDEKIDETAQNSEESRRIGERKKHHLLTTKYPRMMDPERMDDDEYYKDTELPAMIDGVPGPRWLRPDGVTAEVIADKASRFNEAFKPISELSAEDVVCGCTVKGAEMVAESRDHLGKFRTAIREADTITSLEAGQLCELPVAATKAFVGVTFYSAAAGVRFAPKAIQLAKRKASEWQVIDKAALATQFVKTKSIESIQFTVQGTKIAFSWLKQKALAFYGFDQHGISRAIDSVDDDSGGADAQV
mmetsp:Transcript_9646/g.13374  ORF Transcript_9646/g.13374 Transcript_9646/m.13374 type:complete len:310 (-) Transcript_9646:1434-2363(-)